MLLKLFLKYFVKKFAILNFYINFVEIFKQNTMKKRTGILINSIIILLGANYESYLLLGAGVLCLSLVLISKTKRDEVKN
jgi:hypothetical protein